MPRNYPTCVKKMRLSKRYIGRIFLIVESFVFLLFYLFGNNGITALNKLKQEVSVLEQNNSQMRLEIQQLSDTIKLQKNHPFFKEKIAREQLQMARENEEIYFY